MSLKAIDMEDLNPQRAGVAFKIKPKDTLENFRYNLDQAFLALKRHMQAKGAVDLSFNEVKILAEEGKIKLFYTWTQASTNETRGI